MSSSLANSHPTELQDGMCSVYSAQPSETNCSIREAKEVTAVNQLPDELADASDYGAPLSETNVTASDHFQPCPSMDQFNMSVYSALKSETNVTMMDAFKRCKDLANVVYSTYTAPPSETNVTMADNFRPHHVINDMGKDTLATEYTAKDVKFDCNTYVRHLQRAFEIPDSKLIGLQGSDGSLAMAIDSNECLQHLEHFEPIPVEFGSVLSEPPVSVESYLVHSSRVQHEI